MANSEISNTAPIKKDCAKPIYAQVVDYLRDNIASGAWEQASKIPSEIELVATLEVSRGSIKKAISKLVDEGVLEQIQGKGTYVKSQDISFPLTEGLISFSESLNEQGIVFDTRILSCEIRKADAELSEHLGISEGCNYLHLERVRSVDGDPIMFIENNINSELAPGVETSDFVNEGLFSIIERLSGHQVEYSKTSFIATLADPQHAETLNISTDSPVLQQIQTVYLDNDQAIEHARVWLKSSRFHLGTVFQRRRQ